MYADKEYIIALRHELHEYPEVGFDLPRTIALADEKETKIIYDYLCDRCEQFGTDIEIKDQTTKVNFND